MINNLEAVKRALVEAARRAQATIVDVVFHEFNPFGISGVVVIAESHLSIHTWPEYRYAAVDIFSCGDVLKPEVAASYLVEQFAAERASVVEMRRGGHAPRDPQVPLDPARGHGRHRRRGRRPLPPASARNAPRRVRRLPDRTPPRGRPRLPGADRRAL